MGSPWTDILTAGELVEFWRKTADLDPRFAARSKAFYERQSIGQLKSLETAAWLCNTPDAYQLSRSYAALLSTN